MLAGDVDTNSLLLNLKIEIAFFASDENRLYSYCSKQVIALERGAGIT